MMGPNPRFLTRADLIESRSSFVWCDGSIRRCRFCWGQAKACPTSLGSDILPSDAQGRELTAAALQ